MTLDNNQVDLLARGLNPPEDFDITHLHLSASQLYMIQKINKAVENGFDFGDPSNEDENEIHPIDCKYYSTEKFNEQNFNSIKHVSSSPQHSFYGISY